MTVLDQTKFIGLEKLIVLDKLKTILGDFLITGSLSLLAFDIIKRKIGDLDIILDDYHKVDLLKSKFEVSEHFDYNNEIIMNKEIPDTIDKKDRKNYHKIPNVYRTIIDGIRVCVFIRKNLEFNTITFLSNRVFKVTLPEETIKSKIIYIKNMNELELKSPLENSLKKSREKHLSDIWEYNKIK